MFGLKLLVLDTKEKLDCLKAATPRKFLIYSATPEIGLWILVRRFKKAAKCSKIVVNFCS